MKDRHDLSRRKRIHPRPRSGQACTKASKRSWYAIPLQIQSRFRAVTTDAFKSLFSEDILEYEFLKKFMILTMVATSVRAIRFNISAYIRIRW